MSKTLPPSRLRLTRRYEMLKQCVWKPLAECMGGSGLAILVALQYFHADDWQKGLLSGAPYWGLLLGPISVLLVNRLGLSVSKAMGYMAFVCAIGLVIGASASGITLFIIGVCLTTTFQGMTAPLQTALWRQNIPALLRGRLFGLTAVGGTLAALVASTLVSLWMGEDAGRFRPVFLILAVLVCLIGFGMMRIPSQPLDSGNRRNPFSVLHLLFKNKLFGYLSFVWMIMGFGNLMTIPLRVEYAGSADRGLELSAGMVVFLTLVLPEFTGMLATLIWSRLFDRMNFMLLRMLINVFFLISIVVFFTGGFTSVVIGSLFFGIGKGGGQIAWSLWVTKFCEPDRTADYMSVHTFLTGCRGLCGGYVAFWLLGSGLMEISSIGWTGAAMIGVATLLILPIVHLGKRTD